MLNVIIVQSLIVSCVKHSFSIYKYNRNNLTKLLRFNNIHRLSMSTSATSIHSDSSEDDGLNSLLINNLNIVRERIQRVSIENNRDETKPVRLVAVSKTKPSESIKILYDNGQRDFGENYFQELVDKAAFLPQDIRWHFIGHLQSSKASKLIRNVPNLQVLETIDSIKLANKVQSACDNVGRESLDIFIQVDTSNEETKSGVDLSEVVSVANEIIKDCPALKIRGLMTIGAPGDMTCFDKLVQARLSLAEALRIEDVTSLELSMGMSGDFEVAIAKGATSVRVGSTIFGPRIYLAK